MDDRDLFAARCHHLESELKLRCSSGYSDREIVSVLIEILKEEIQKQENPERALIQVVRVLRE